MKPLQNQQGFSLLELTLVITLISIIAVGVAPLFVDLQGEAHEAQRDGMIGSILDGINMKFADNLLNNNHADFPTELDSSANALCSAANPCFSNVLQAPLTDHWLKTSTNTYMHLETNVHYYYDLSDGTFLPHP